MAIGHVMLDVEGFDLTQLEKEVLRHPQVGGVILFSRNYESKQQLGQLTKAIRKGSADCIIAVDQEGGRVQRFRKDFLPLPPFSAYGQLYEKNQDEALIYTRKMAKSMAQELKEYGVDISFSPVLDIDIGRSEVIGERSFHFEVNAVAELGRAFIQGMHDAGMPATGKHFPGHGYVSADSHLTLPVDNRSYEDIYQTDIQPFVLLKNELDAVMPAHVLYEHVDNYPTCFSEFWLQTVLREKIKFTGVIFSDDLTMAGAGFIPDFLERGHTALAAGCDMILVCNHQEKAIKMLEFLEDYNNPSSENRLNNFRVL